MRTGTTTPAQSEPGSNGSEGVLLTSQFFRLFVGFLWHINLLYSGKEKIHSEMELIIYQLKWYSPTSIISLTLEVPVV